MGTETTMHCVDHCLFCCCGALTWLPQSWQKEFYKHRAVSCREAEKLGQMEAERKLYFKFVSTIEEWISRIVAGGRKNMYVKLRAHEHDRRVDVPHCCRRQRENLSFKSVNTIEEEISRIVAGGKKTLSDMHFKLREHN